MACYYMYSRKYALLKIPAFQGGGRILHSICGQYAFSAHPPLQLHSKIPCPWALGTYMYMYGMQSVYVYLKVVVT